MDSLCIINESINYICHPAWYDGKVSCLEGLNYNGLTRSGVNNCFLYHKVKTFPEGSEIWGKNPAHLSDISRIT